MQDRPVALVIEPLGVVRGQRRGRIAPVQPKKVLIEPTGTIEIIGDDIDVIERVDPHWLVPFALARDTVRAGAVRTPLCSPAPSF